MFCHESFLHKKGDDVMKESKNAEEKIKRIKDILKDFGIRTNKDLDDALSDALETMTIGIMTEKPVKVNLT